MRLQDPGKSVRKKFGPNEGTPDVLYNSTTEKLTSFANKLYLQFMNLFLLYHFFSAVFQHQACIAFWRLPLTFLFGKTWFLRWETNFQVAKTSPAEPMQRFAAHAEDGGADSSMCYRKGRNKVSVTRGY